MDPFAEHTSGYSVMFGTGLVSVSATLRTPAKHYVIIYRWNPSVGVVNPKKYATLGPYEKKPTFSEAMAMMAMYLQTQEGGT